MKTLFAICLVFLGVDRCFADTTILDADLIISTTPSTSDKGIVFQDGTKQLTAGGGFGQRIIIEEQQPKGTNAGACNGGGWKFRKLNAEVLDSGDDATVNVYSTSGTVTLSAGSYFCDFRAGAGNVGSNVLRLVNVTDSVVISTGMNAHSNQSGYLVFSFSRGVTQFTLGSSKELGLEHYCETTTATYDLGVAANVGIERYSRLVCTKE